MSEQADKLKERTLHFALEILQLVRTFPDEEPGPTVRRQLTRCSTSVGANYRAACRARSHAEFTSRIGIVAEEADETMYWLAIAAGANLTTGSALSPLEQESRELTAIFSRAVGTARLNARQRLSKPGIG
jgi:four helix bundle protein